MQVQLCPGGGHAEGIMQSWPAPGAMSWPLGTLEDYLISELRPASIWEKTRKLVSAGVV